jgi:hypothetical protein
MRPHDAEMACQMPDLGRISAGIAGVPPQSLSRRAKLMLRRHLSPSSERRLKRYTNDLVDWWYRITGRAGRAPGPTSGSAPVRLQVGDRVRVRTQEEISTTLDHWRQLRGCTFMPEMARYCGTSQQVLKPLERFVDERDLRVKKSKGIVLLEGVTCEGTAAFGRCDRSCFLFWRVEWLEKI